MTRSARETPTTGGAVNDWWIYKGDRATDRLGRLAAHQPPWRAFDGRIDDDYVVPSLDDDRYAGDRKRGAGYIADEPEIELVNTALYLRRPLLVTGVPGVGKSTLAYSIAEDLDLGPVLRWPVTSRTTLRDGLYRYDALRRLEDANLRRLRQQQQQQQPRPDQQRPLGEAEAVDAIGKYLQLGPLGTAFLPTARPRVLLIDEIDKGDIDLPGDLLTVLDEGRFDIPELARISESSPTVPVGTDDRVGTARITGGSVRLSRMQRGVSRLSRRRPHQQRRTRVPARVPAPLHPAQSHAARRGQAAPHHRAAHRPGRGR
jgi:hypothetical protein